LRRVFDVDPMQLEIMRIDVAADIVGALVSFSKTPFVLLTPAFSEPWF
jgi:hypothetical protein